jgi:membrane peptidoglycan carboxypeptidase
MYSQQAGFENPHFDASQPEHREHISHRLRPGDPGYSRHPHRSKHPFWKAVGIIFLILVLGGIGVFAWLYATIQVPAPESIALSQKTTVYYSDGKTPVGTLAQQNRKIIGCTALPSYVGDAVVASENRTFWTDSGIDLRGIARAALNNVTKGTRQGGSTITQQYAERYYLGQTDTYIGKLHEAILALKISQTQNKSQILCNYLNTIYLGRDAYGIQAAAQNYFGVDASKLSLEQSALLAGIIPAPNVWDPAIHKDLALKRYQRVLKIMLQDKKITAAQQQHALSHFPQTITYKPSNIYQGPKGYILQMVRTELTRSKAFTADEVETGGYTIRTTINKSAQDQMQKIASPRPAGLPKTAQQGAASIDPRTGAIVAMYAGDDFLTHQYSNATQAHFEPGSTVKPFTLLTAINKGASPRTVFNGNSPRRFAGLTSSVSNSGGVSYGPINLYQALANSVNTAFVDLNECVGSRATAQTMKDAGMSDPIDASSPYNTLGINSVSALELANAHATLISGGVRHTPHIVASVKNSSGKELYQAPTSGTTVFNKQDTQLVVQAMRGVVLHGTGRQLAGLGREFAAKTGTANDQTAYSFVASTPSLTTVFAVWNVDQKGSPAKLPFTINGLSESQYPEQLFVRYAQSVFRGKKAETFPLATDKGKIGGPNGTWGLGYGSSVWSMAGLAGRASNEEKENLYSGNSQMRRRYRELENERHSESTQNSQGTQQPGTPTQNQNSAPSTGEGTNGSSPSKNSQTENENDTTNRPPSEQNPSGQNGNENGNETQQTSPSGQ